MAERFTAGVRARRGQMNHGALTTDAVSHDLAFDTRPLVFEERGSSMRILEIPSSSPRDAGAAS